MSNFAMFTQIGLDSVANAVANGQLLEIGAFVPVYDYRYDPYIGLLSAVSLSALEISAYTSPDDQYPQGEIIWNTSVENDYFLSETPDYLIQTSGDTVTENPGDTVVSKYVHKNKVQINTFKTLPITTHYTATEVLNPGMQDNDWHFKPEDITTIAPSNAPADLSAVPLSALFRGVTYHPVISGTDKIANFKVTCRCPVGQFKFNKLGLYGTIRTATTIISDYPFLLAQVILPEPQILYSNQTTVTSGFSLSQFVLDVEVDTAEIPNNFENMWYGTSADYWTRIINQNDGLYGIIYDGFVAVSQSLAIEDQQDVFTTSAKTTPSKFLVSTFENINSSVPSAEKNMPQMCIQYVDSNENRIRTTFKTIKNGDCEIDMYGSENELTSIVPRFDGEIGLGTNINGYKRWDHLHLKNYLEITDVNFEDINAVDFKNFMLSVNNDVNVYNGDVVISPYYSSATQEIPKHYNYLYGNISSLRVTSGYGYIYPNDLLVKSFNDIIIATLSQESDVAGYDSQEIIRILWTMDTDPSGSEVKDLLADQKDIIIASSRNIKIAGNIIPFKYKPCNLGRIDIPMIATYSKTLVTDNICNFENSDLLIRSNSDLAIATMNKGTVVDLWTMNNNTTDYLHEPVVSNFPDLKDVLIAASRDIRFKGHIVPFKNKTDNIGSPDKYIKELWVDKINCNNIVNVGEIHHKASNTSNITDLQQYSQNGIGTGISRGNLTVTLSIILYKDNTFKVLVAYNGIGASGSSIGIGSYGRTLFAIGQLKLQNIDAECSKFDYVFDEVNPRQIVWNVDSKDYTTLLRVVSFSNTIAVEHSMAQVSGGGDLGLTDHQIAFNFTCYGKYFQT